MKIGQRQISPDHSPYIIAELSGNHNGDIHNMFRLIDEAKLAGADAVKLQCYTPDTITMDSDKDDFRIKDGQWGGRTLYDLYREAHTPPEWFERIFDYARNVRDIEVFASVFDETAIDLLERLNVSAYKIASFELTDLPLIEATAATGKPVILSTGMGQHQEILDALNTVNRFSINPGWRLDQQGLQGRDGGPDSSFSLEPLEFAALVKACKEAWEATRPSHSPVQAANLQFRRSVYVTADVSAGETLSKENIRVIRPAFGLAPKFYPSVLGRKAAVALEKGTPLSLDHLAASDGS